MSCGEPADETGRCIGMGKELVRVSGNGNADQAFDVASLAARWPSVTTWGENAEALLRESAHAGMTIGEWKKAVAENSDPHIAELQRLGRGAPDSEPLAELLEIWEARLKISRAPAPVAQPVIPDRFPNVQAIRQEGYRILARNPPKEVVRELKDGVKRGFLGYVGAKGLAPAVYFVPELRDEAMAAREAVVRQAVAALEKIMVQTD
jgi:hypothetical protein